MSFSQGQDVRINKFGLSGKIVRERNQGEDIYLVHIEDQYFKSSDLELLSGEQAKYPLKAGSQEYIEEQERCANLQRQWASNTNNLDVAAALLASMAKLGFFG